MKKIKKYSQYVIVIMAIMLSVIGFKVEAGVTNHTTGAVSVHASDGTCPRCSWYFGGAYASGIRLGLYKYEGDGKPIKCGESLDLLNTASRIESGSLITNGYSRLDYTHGGKSVNFYNGFVKVNDSSSKIRAESVKKYNGGNTYLLTVPEGSNQDPWGLAFVKNFSNYLQ